MEVALAETPEDWKRCFPIMNQLRPQYSEHEFVEAVATQINDGYKLAMALHENSVSAVAGFVISHKLAWGKHLYVDDLVTNQNQRSMGAGKFLLDWLKEYARSQSCEQLHLDSGVQRFSAHKFYLREGMNIASHHFQQKL